jgi:hypothetical protein
VEGRKGKRGRERTTSTPPTSDELEVEGWTRGALRRVRVDSNNVEMQLEAREASCFHLVEKSDERELASPVSCQSRARDSVRAAEEDNEAQKEANGEREGTTEEEEEENDIRTSHLLDTNATIKSSTPPQSSSTVNVHLPASASYSTNAVPSRFLNRLTC